MNWKKYFEFSRMGFQEASAYRFNSLMSIGTSVLYLVLYYAIWSSIAASGQLSASLSSIMAYLVLGQVIHESVFMNPESFFGERIRKGTITNELKRPVSVRAQSYFYEVGWASFRTVARSIPLLAFGIAFYSVNIPSALESFYFLLSIFLSFNLIYALSFSTSMLVFWTKVDWSIRMMKNMTISLFSGIMFPLYLLPENLKPIFNLLPFQAMADGPITVFLGEMTTSQTLQLFGKQLAWMLLFLILGELLWRKAKTKLTVQGG